MSGPAGKGFDKGLKAQTGMHPKSDAGLAGSGPHGALLALQQAAGNQALTKLLAGGPGRPLDPATRRKMESKFGEDFRDVEVHANGDAAKSAAALGANAWTRGGRIVFGEGRYAPETRGGRELLAHELAHVVQQRRGGTPPQTFETQSASESDAGKAASQIASPGPVTVSTSTSAGVARDEAELPWWKKRLNPIYQRALQVLPPEAAQKLQEANAAAKQFVQKSGTSDETLNRAVKSAEPILGPISDALGAPEKKTDEAKPLVWLGEPPLSVQLDQRRKQQESLGQSGQGTLADPEPPRSKNAVSDLPPLDVLLRPDPPPTDFEQNLKAGKPFNIKIHPHPDIDPRNAVWLGKRPSDEELKRTRFTDPNDPTGGRIWVDSPEDAEKDKDLRIDSDSTIPIRDPKTNELKGYKVRHGDTMWVVDRQGKLRGNYNLERPLEAPVVDPIDLALLAVDLGPLAAKGITAGGKALFKAFAKSGVREAAEFGGDESARLLAREASDALESGLSHPSKFPELDLNARPANDLNPLPRGEAANDVLAGEAENQASTVDNVLRLDEYRPPVVEEPYQLPKVVGEDFASDQPFASAGRSGSRGNVLKGSSRPVGRLEADTATRVGSREATAGAVKRGPTIARFGQEEVDHLAGMWEERLAKETDPERAKVIDRYIRNLRNRSRIPSSDWEQSEEEVAHIYSQIGGKGETQFKIAGEDGVARITKPDFVAPNVRGEVKNWTVINIQSEEGAEQMLNGLAKQIKDRGLIDPKLPQTVVLDLRGQKISESQLQAIGRTFAERTGLPVENIQILVWAK